MSRGKLNAASLLKVSKESESEKVKVMAKCQSNFKQDAVSVSSHKVSSRKY